MHTGHHYTVDRKFVMAERCKSFAVVKGITESTRYSRILTRARASSFARIAHSRRFADSFVQSNEF